eukprot:comp19237_c0_seq1/m.22010 comp19237_c0_seq1/g.22010  ORF comp19237_c0_seq1/g.22010 comp19237_c0_seq1/m.22010 type:complete len:295 (-) comp19237_c0_seq1:359-1243(-)
MLALRNPPPLPHYPACRLQTTTNMSVSTVAAVILAFAASFGTHATTVPMERPRRDGWVQFPKGTTWVLRAWCKGGPCNQAPINDEKMVTMSWYYDSAELIKSTKDEGKIVTCYMSAGAVMPFERKADPELPLGRSVSGWDLTYLNILDQGSLRGFMSKRLKDAAAKGCQAIEFDNVDCWQNECVPGYKPYNPELKKAQLSYLRWLAEEAHSLGMAAGLKNSLYLVEDLVDTFDFAVNEQCHQWNECHFLKPFLDKNKAVFGTEYQGDAWKICQDARAMGITQKYDMNGKGWRDC